MPKKGYTNERAKFIRDYINKSSSTSNAIKELSKRLFLSERQIERDFKKNL